MQTVLVHAMISTTPVIAALGLGAGSPVVGLLVAESRIGSTPASDGRRHGVDPKWHEAGELGFLELQSAWPRNREWQRGSWCWLLVLVLGKPGFSRACHEIGT